MLYYIYWELEPGGLESLWLENVRNLGKPCIPAVPVGSVPGLGFIGGLYNSIIPDTSGLDRVSASLLKQKVTS